MSDVQTFCCVGCGKLMCMDMAQQLFRTGYYRVHIPLGYCKLCSEAAVRRSNEALEADELDVISSGEIAVHIPVAKLPHTEARPLFYIA